MCRQNTPWPELFPTVLLGLRTCFTEDIKASAAEMMYDTQMRLQNEYLSHDQTPVNPQTFLGKF